MLWNFKLPWSVPWSGWPCPKLFEVWNWSCCMLWNHLDMNYLQKPPSWIIRTGSWGSIARTLWQPVSGGIQFADVHYFLHVSFACFLVQNVMFFSFAFVIFSFKFVLFCQLISLCLSLTIHECFKLSAGHTQCTLHSAAQEKKAVRTSRLVKHFRDR